MCLFQKVFPFPQQAAKTARSKIELNAQLVDFSVSEIVKKWKARRVTVPTVNLMLREIRDEYTAIEAPRDVP